MLYLGHAATSHTSLLQLRPSSETADESGDSSGRDAHGKNNFKTSHVAGNDKRLLVRRECVSNLGSASEDKGSQVNLGCVLENVVDHLIDECSLASRDEIGTSNTLED